MSAHRRLNVLAVMVLCVVTLVPYLQVVRHDYIYYDDQDYVTDNPVVQQGMTASNIAWAFTTRSVSNWHPLTWLSYLVDYELFGLNAGAQLLVNVALHLANGLLLYALLQHLTGAWGRSLFVAALFLVHPLHVESVAWVSERKDVLSTLFFLLSLMAYARSVGDGRRAPAAWYALSLLAMAVGLMAKPMLVTLPFVLLLIDFWPLGRLRESSRSALPGGSGSRPTGSAGAEPSRTKDGSAGASPSRVSVQRLLIEKIPFLLLALASSVMTMWAQRQAGALDLVQGLTLPLRLANATVAYAAYVIKMFWPIHLTPFYPHPIHWPAGNVLATLVLLMLLTVAAVRSARSRPYLLFGWLWFLGTLVPVIGVVQAGAQSMADRYTYVPLSGPLIAVTWLAHDWLARKHRVEIVAGTIIVIVLMTLTFVQVRRWQDSQTLFTHNLEVVGDNPLAHNVLGHYFAERKQPDKAIEHFGIAVELAPADFKSNYNMAAVLARFGHPAEAIPFFERTLRTLRTHPRSARLLGEFAATLERAGQDERARAMVQAARAVDPAYSPPPELARELQIQP